MPGDNERSFDNVMARLKAGDQQVAREVFERFVQRLIALAEARFGGKLRRKIDPEDVVQSVFKSFFARQKNDQYHPESWDGLWGLLAAITIHKCGHKIEHFHAACRDVGNEKSSFFTSESSSDWEVVARDPTPSQAMILNETIEKLLDPLDEREKQIVRLSLQGWSTAEIGPEVRCSERTARRVLNEVRQQLELMREGK